MDNSEAKSISIQIQLGNLSHIKHNFVNTTRWFFYLWNFPNFKIYFKFLSKFKFCKNWIFVLFVQMFGIPDRFFCFFLFKFLIWLHFLNLIIENYYFVIISFIFLIYFYSFLLQISNIREIHQSLYAISNFISLVVTTYNS